MPHLPNPSAVERDEALAALKLMADKLADHFTDDEQGLASSDALDLVELAGFDTHDSDRHGDATGAHLHLLLYMALLRCPELAERD